MREWQIEAWVIHRSDGGASTLKKEVSGPFSTRAAAESFAVALANRTSVAKVELTPVGE